MIDDYAQAMELIRKMEASLPIPARPTGGFIRAMKAQGVKPGHPLAEEIRAYQRERKRRLAQAGGSREPTFFTVKPRKKRKR